jgi:hypothetical protein
MHICSISAMGSLSYEWDMLYNADDNDKGMWDVVVVGMSHKDI